jgi:hypothetical protein
MNRRFTNYEDSVYDHFSSRVSSSLSEPNILLLASPVSPKIYVFISATESKLHNRIKQCIKLHTAIFWVMTRNIAFQRCFPPAFKLVPCLAHSSTLKMEATCFSETSAGFQRTTWRCITEGRTLQTYFCVTTTQIQTSTYNFIRAIFIFSTVCVSLVHCCITTAPCHSYRIIYFSSSPPNHFDTLRMRLVSSVRRVH